MAGFNDVHIVSLPIGAFSGATEKPMLYLPVGGGGITVLSAHAVGPSAGTIIGGELITMTAVGTPALSGTIGAFGGTIVTAAGVVFEATVSDGYVAEGTWFGFDQASGTVPAGTFISLAYVMGKSGS